MFWNILMHGSHKHLVRFQLWLISYRTYESQVMASNKGKMKSKTTDFSIKSWCSYLLLTYPTKRQLTVGHFTGVWNCNFFSGQWVLVLVHTTKTHIPSCKLLWSVLLGGTFLWRNKLVEEFLVKFLVGVTQLKSKQGLHFSHIFYCLQQCLMPLSLNCGQAVTGCG
jgi:hypothetical protein